MYQFSFDNRRSSGFSGIGCLVFGVLFAVALYYIFKGLYYLLYWASPVLFIAALVINWRAVAEVGKGFLRLLERNLIWGVLVGFLAAVAFPLTALYLFMAALGGQKADEMRQEFERRMGGAAAPPKNAEYVDFEEVESTPKGNPESFEPPALPEKEAPKKPSNPYDEMFG